MTFRQPIVAIDGPAGSGKSTVALQVAERTGLQFISSGAMYRAVALHALRASITVTDAACFVELAARLTFCFTTDEQGTVHTCVDGEDVTDALRMPEVGALASTIATIPALRAQLVAKQQAYGQDGGVIMEGRDIQTVVFPNADIKIFLTASEEERARRRWNELTERGEFIPYQSVLDEVCARDRRDEERDVSPLRPAEDAICVNTDNRTIAEVVDILVQLIIIWRAHPDLHGDSLARAAGFSKGTCH